MTSFISAGHYDKDPGASGNGFQENKLTIELRALVICELHKHNITIIYDHDDESLAQYLHRIQPGNASVVCEFHFDAASRTATGTTAIVANKASNMSRAFAAELAEATADTLGIKNRGVITEAQSARGTLGLMREPGCVSLLEVCFISNADDMAKYQANKESLAAKLAEIIAKYDNMIS